MEAGLISKTCDGSDCVPGRSPRGGRQLARLPAGETKAAPASARASLPLGGTQRGHRSEMGQPRPFMQMVRVSQVPGCGDRAVLPPPKLPGDSRSSDSHGRPGKCQEIRGSDREEPPWDRPCVPLVTGLLPAARSAQCGQRLIRGPQHPASLGLLRWSLEGVWALTLVPKKAPCDFFFHSLQQRERCPIFK